MKKQKLIPYVNSFQSQYNKIYINRLSHFEPILKKILKNRNITLTNLINISKQPSKNLTNDDLFTESLANHNLNKSAIIGTVFVISDLKPSIFDELKFNKRKESKTYYKNDVKYFIEDLSGRIEILLNDEMFLCSGMVIACVGFENEKGKFVVEEIILPGYYEDKKSYINSNEYKICLCSGIECDFGNNDKKMEIIFDNINVDEIVIFGNLFGKINEQENIKNGESLTYKIDLFNKIIQKRNIKITLIPNINDPTSLLLPQEPFHKMIFDFNNLPNPCFYAINNKNYILCSGTNVEDMLKYKKNDLKKVQNEAADYMMHKADENTIKDLECDFSVDDYLDVMDYMLRLQHICPSAPDTLKTIPLEKDEFIISSPVNYFICGNAPGFGKRYVNDEKTLLICVPEFNKTGEVVLFDTKNNVFEKVHI